jgi:sigma-B regulation protein RsbU (phosphoserine phosphatase)
VIVLYTDGVTEAKNAAGEEYHFERLADCVIRAAGAPSEAITRDIIQSVHTHTGSTEHEDDITVLVLRWTGTHWDPGAPPPAGGTEP